MDPERSAVDEALLSAPRLGVFGGTFDPVHAGHLHAAREARRAFDLDLVLFVPAARSPHKDAGPHASAEQRFEMLELALAGEPAFAVSALELRRGEPSYTIETVRELSRTRAEAGNTGELFLILGSDNLSSLATWRGVEEIFDLARPIVVFRRGAGPELVERAAGLSPELAERLREGFLELPPVDVAASDLRASGGGRTEELPDAVREYVRGRGIYGER